MLMDQLGSNVLTLVKLVPSASWSACKQSGHAELLCTMVAIIALHAASLVAVCIAYLQLPLIIVSHDKCIGVHRHLFIVCMQSLLANTWYFPI